MNRVNYQTKLDRLLKSIREREEAPALLLHSCCAPCSSYVLEYLTDYFHTTVFYYNPNITPDGEYEKRKNEQKRLLSVIHSRYPVKFLECGYHPGTFFEMAKGRENCPEGGERCFACYELRLRETARRAAENKFDYFGTTLSVSPYKNAGKLNEIGGRLSEEYGVPYLYSDFKKRGGYLRSIELSGEYGLYRQDYCGCIFSKREKKQQ